MLVWLALLLGAAGGAAGGAGDEARGPHCTSPLCHLQGVSLNEYVFNIDGSNESVSVEWVPGEYLAVRCARDVAGGAAAMPALPPAAAAPRAALAACAAPAPALRRLRLPPPPRLALLALPAAPLDAAYFAGLEAVGELRLSAAPPAAPPLLPGALAALPSLHTLRTDGVRVQLDALPAALRVLSVRGGGGGGVRAGWGAARAALRRLVLAPVGDAAGLGGAPSLQVLELESVSALWAGALPALENVTLRGLAGVRGGELAGSARLRALRVEGGAAGSLPARWLAGLPALRSVLLRRLPLRALPADLLTDSPALQVLEVSRCSLQALPPALLRGQARLAELLLDHNNITYLDPEVFSGTSSLVSLSLTHNALSSLSFLARLPALRRLRADDNPLGDTCGDQLSSLSPLRHCPALREAGLARSGAARLCADWRLLLTRLAVLDLRGNRYTDLQGPDLHWVRAGDAGAAGDAGGAVVLLGDNPLTTLLLREEDYHQLLNRNHTQASVTLDLSGCPLRCDCLWYWWVRGRRAGGGVAARGRCAGGEGGDGGGGLDQLDPDLLECKDKECPSSCDCSVRAALPTVTRASCASPPPPGAWGGRRVRLAMEARGITAVPRVDNVTALLLSGNRIEEVREEDLPDGLEELDLSNNSLRSLPPRALRPPRLRLARNPWRCACPDQPLLDAARERQQHIVDYTSIRCADGRAWAALGAGALCPPAPAPGLAPPAPAPAAAWLALPAALLLAAAAAAVAYYYRYHVKLFLSSHGWPTPAPNATHAPHARYDVFVSFSHADEAWVQRELLPRLQAARTVCVHYNDWVAGEGIPQQIASSVASSHRTLCILSAAAVHAPWPREERRAALAHSSAVLLLLEPVDNLANGEPELKAHLATRTYLTKDDPRLWEKLLVALPPAPRAPAPRAPAPARGKGKGGDKMEKEAGKVEP